MSNKLINKVTIQKDKSIRQVFIRCTRDTIQIGYQEYLRLILLLNKRQLPAEEIKQSESWTRY